MGEKPTEADESGERKMAQATQQEQREAAAQAGGGAPAGIAVSDPGVPNRLAAGDINADGPAEAANLNSSKSNIERVGSAGGTPDPAEAINLNSSRSNIYREAADGGGGGGAEDREVGPARPSPGPAQPSPGPADPGGPGPAHGGGP